MTPTLFAHQQVTRDFILDVRRVLIFSDPGVGKTASALAAYAEHRAQGGGRMLVLAPKAILEPAWVDDCRTFTPQLSIEPAYAKNRAAPFKSNCDIVVTNHDAAKWLAKHPEFLQSFDTIVLDEITAYKNRQAQRSQAAAALAKHFDLRIGMTGTPFANGLLDVWHQAYLIDDGETLGTRFFAFRQVTHDPIPIGPNVNEWREKDGAREAVADMLADISIRYRFEDCVDIPANHTTTRSFELPPKLRRAYDDMLRRAMLKVENGEIEAINAASEINKLLQIASGAVYDGNGEHHLLDTSRYDLIAELCAERPHTVVGFLWRHQRIGLIAALERAGISDYAILDGEHNRDHGEVVRNFQAGHYRVLLAHPQSAGHGLTLTRAATLIWASPTWNAEHFEQFNRRIYRTGQTQRTETILIQAGNTADERVYAKLRDKVEGQINLLGLLQDLTGATYRSASTA